MRDTRPQWAKKGRIPRIPLPPISTDHGAASGPADTGVELELGLGEPEPEPVTLAGWLVEATGREVPGGRVEIVCRPDDGGRADRRRISVDQDGYFEVTVDGPTTCDLFGYRMDGVFRALSQLEGFALAPGEFVEVDLVLPAERTGGLGVRISSHEAGWEIQRVYGDTPADRLGLRSGDVVTEVAGVSTAGMSLFEFQQLMTGPEGSEVDFVIQPDGDVDAEPAVLTSSRQSLESRN